MKKVFLLLTSLCISCQLFSQAPEVRITFPYNHYYELPFYPTINVDASDADGNVKSVEFFVGNTKIGEDTVAPYDLEWIVYVPGFYTLTAKAYDNDGNVSISDSITYVALYKTNLRRTLPVSVGKPTYASSIESSQLTADKATDESSETRWSSKFTDSEWIYVDLGSSYDIKQVAIHWEYAYASQYLIQVSNDKKIWKTIIENHDNKTLNNSFTHPTGTYEFPGRYVRLFMIQRGTGFGYSIFNFVVEGNPTNSRSTLIDLSIDKKVIGPGDRVYMSGNAYDPESSLEKVEIFAGNSPIGRANISSNGIFDFTFYPMPMGDYVITAVATDGAGSKTTTMPQTIKVVPNGGLGSFDLARNKPASSSSMEGDLFLPNYAVDNNLSTRFSSGFSDDEWLEIDLGDSCLIKTFEILWETAYGKNFKIQLSNDLVTWEDVIVEENNTSLHNTFTESTGYYYQNGRYVRILGLQRATGFGYSIIDFRVYGNYMTKANLSKGEINLSKREFIDDLTVSREEFFLSPNPVSQELNIHLANPNKEEIGVSLFDSYGKNFMVLQPTTTSEIKLDMTEFFGGVYTIQLQRGNKKFSKKFVKI